MNETFPQHNSCKDSEPGQAPDSPADTETRQHDHEPTPQPLIYVASVADHDAGRVHGVWLDAAREPEEIYDDIAAMVAASSTPGAERVAIQDSEGFGLAHIDAADSIELVSKIARGIAEHGYAFAVWGRCHRK